ncbi:unnamed protein product [Lymnaea stagnalis]|uniref:Sulfotransferase domain-containing protein n=1 Tax=Lymnaea stagnalis TaxID=6523 RepID=A0AAV2HA83_LYMST
MKLTCVSAELLIYNHLTRISQQRRRMFQRVKRFLYDLIVWSGIINYLTLLIRPMLRKIISKTKSSNYKVVDSSGASMDATLLQGKVFPPVRTSKILSISGMRIRKDDAFLCGYPKTGCHWMYEIMQMLTSGRAQLSKQGKELGGMIDLVPDIVLDSLPSPRILNSHLHYDELPKGVKENKTKIVLTVRNPKDTVVSHYNHHKVMTFMYGYDGKFDDYFELFMAGKLEFGDYFEHVLSWDRVMKTQNDNPVLMVSFEDLKARPVEMVRTVARFLGKSVTDQLAEDIVKACDFDVMKEKRKKEGGVDATMFRKGKVGDWRNWLTDSQSEAIDAVWREKMMACSYQPDY